LYPYNKEMHAFVRFPELLDFEVVGVADPLGKGLVGQDAGTAIGIDPTGVRIAARLADALAGADTLILGYVDELGRIAGRDVLRDSIQLALDHGLNVFSFLPVRREEYEELHRMARLQNLKIACPSVSFDAIREMLVTPLKYGPVQMPVLAVLGTGPQQGKFTLQLSLRRSLLHKGYKVGQLGTEHHSALFGFDSTFPMGYASPLELPVQLFGPYLDFQMREIAHTTNPDILLAGAQSGTVPYNVGDPNTHTLASLAFLFGIKPDACVLVVNSIDSYTYIGDTIEAIRALSKAPVISLAMSDREKDVQTAYGRSWIQPRLLTDTEISKRLRDLENRFSIPAHQISSPQDQTKLTETVVDYFARTSSEDPCQTEAA
jgi:uncharacterized NAD-dependent epimerase/dehydratase family protein